ncbi:hypothetical protein Bca4012_083844 [Brassica carinata]
MVVIPVTLKGANYLHWAKLAKTALGGRGLWEIVEEGRPQEKTILGEDGKEVVVADAGAKKKGQEDLLMFSILQHSLDPSLQEGYSYCETSKELWDTLQKVYGNKSNLSRVFEVKRAINTLSQEDTDFDKHFGKFRSLWAELEMLRPATTNPDVLNQRREQDKVFDLLLTLHPSYGDLIKHILRNKELPSLDEVCSEIQKEQGSMDNNRSLTIPVTLKGINYLLWARMVKNALGGKGLWSHVSTSTAPKQTVQGEDGKEMVVADEDKWGQEDLMVLTALLSSLDPAIMESYSYCESTKQLWDTLYKVYGNQSNLTRVFEVKRAINALSQGETEFQPHFGKFRSLWAELELLRPHTTDPDTLNSRREEDKVFGLLLTLNPSYGGLIKHILRAEKLPDLDDLDHRRSLDKLGTESTCLIKNLSVENLMG